MRGAATTLSALLILVTVASFVPSNEWWIRVADFPRVQVAVLLAAAAGLVAYAFDMRRWHAWGLLAMLCAALVAQAVRLVPYTPVVAVEVRTGPCRPGRTLRLLVANVKYSNRNSDALRALIRERDPDVALILEPGTWWESELRPLEERLPHVVRQPQENTWGLLMYSRLPLLEPEVRFLVDPAIPSVRTRVRLDSGLVIWLYAVHPRPPRPGDDTAQRDYELTLVAREIAARRGEPAILAGDLNDVGWSRTSRRVRRVAELSDPRIGRGLYATFPATLPLGMRWPLDHVFLTGGFELCALERLADIDSDHLPVLVASTLTN